MRPPATVVIPVWNKWDLTRQCLETLRPTLGARDQVVVVDNGSTDGTAAGLGRFGWVEVVTNQTNRGFAAACNQGAAAARHDVVVFLNNDTLLPARWLDGLIAPFAALDVAATGPRSNFVDGAQVVAPVGYSPGDLAAFRQWARAWREQHRGQTSDVDRLVGFCLAVRRAAFEEVGGFDEQFGIGSFEDDDLCHRLVARRYRLLIAHDSFVHHHGHQTFLANGVDWIATEGRNRAIFEAKHHLVGDPSRPLLSACLIVKDEESNLPRCLQSILGVADEVIVYDTGSADATVAVARAAGATVIEGFWDDDFARARNACLAHAGGEWVLSIDADEVLECQPSQLRAALRRAGRIDVVQIGICNLQGTTHQHQEGLTHQAWRLFRPDQARFAGRLHEQVVAVRDGHELRVGGLADCRLVHYGYLEDEVVRLGKRDRNVRLAELDLEEAGDESTRLANLGRSLLWAGRLDEAFTYFTQAREAATDDRKRCLALRFGLDVLLMLGRPDEADAWIADLAAHAGPGSSMPNYYRALVLLKRGDPLGANELLAEVERLEDEHGSIAASSLLPALRGQILHALGSWEEAAPMLRAAARQGEAVWGPLVTATWKSGMSLTELAGDVDETLIPLVLAQHATTDPDAFDAWLEQLWSRWPARGTLMAAAVRAGAGLRSVRAMEWSARVRQAGVTITCPLIARLANAGAPADDRLRAAAILKTTFGVEPNPDHVAAAAAGIAAVDLDRVLGEIDQLCPGLRPAVVAAAAA